MVVTCFVGTTPGVEVRDFGLDAQVGYDAAEEIRNFLPNWTTLVGELAPAQGDELWRISRHRHHESVWTWIGRYVGVKALGQDRDNGFVGAGILINNSVSLGADIVLYLTEAISLISAHIIRDGRFVRSINSIPPSDAIYWPNSQRLIAASARPLMPNVGLSTDKLDMLYIDFSIRREVTISTIVEWAQNQPEFFRFGRIFFGFTPTMAAIARASTGFDCLTIEQAFQSQANTPIVHTTPPPFPAIAASLREPPEDRSLAERSARPNNAPKASNLSEQSALLSAFQALRAELKSDGENLRGDIDRFQNRTNQRIRENRWLAFASIIINVVLTIAIINLGFAHGAKHKVDSVVSSAVPTSAVSSLPKSELDPETSQQIDRNNFGPSNDTSAKSNSAQGGIVGQSSTVAGFKPSVAGESREGNRTIGQQQSRPPGARSDLSKKKKKPKRATPQSQYNRTVRRRPVSLSLPLSRDFQSTGGGSLTNSGIARNPQRAPGQTNSTAICEHAPRYIFTSK